MLINVDDNFISHIINPLLSGKKVQFIGDIIFFPSQCTNIGVPTNVENLFYFHWHGNTQSLQSGPGQDCYPKDASGLYLLPISFISRIL